MASNYVQPGEILSLIAPYDVADGGGAMIGELFGIAQNTVLSGAEGEFRVCGVVDLFKTSAQAWAVGDPIYWNISTKLASNLASVGPRIGVCLAVAANPSSTGRVRLDATRVDRASYGNVIPGAQAATSKNTAGPVTLTAAEVLSGVVVADPNGAGRTYTLPTAALLVAAVPYAKVGDLIRFKLINGADAAEAITIAEGAGGSWDTNQTAASRTVPQNASKDVLIRLTNVTTSSEAYVVYA